jgi:hypothetical protein
LCMAEIRIGLFLLMATLASAQQPPAVKPTKAELLAPSLPVININACPQSAVSKPYWLARGELLYSSWRGARTQIGVLQGGSYVTVLEGVEVIAEPDQAILTQRGAGMLVAHGLVANPGDVVLRYGLQVDRNGDRNWDLWADGAWFTAHEDSMTTGCGSDDQGQCMFALAKYGLKEWWLKVKTTAPDSTGWTIAGEWSRNKSYGGFNFRDLCRTDFLMNGDGTPITIPPGAISPPNLPVININASPQNPLEVTLTSSQPMYSSWRDDRVLAETLKAGETVTGVVGLEVIREPDQAKLTQRGVEMLESYGFNSLTGDLVLRFGLRDGGTWDFWTQGAWFGLYHDFEADASGCGSADKSQCMFTVVKYGAKERWINVRTTSNHIGWVLDQEWKSGKSSGPNNFAPQSD